MRLTSSFSSLPFTWRLLAQFDRPYPRDLAYDERERLYNEARKFEASQ